MLYLTNWQIFQIAAFGAAGAYFGWGFMKVADALLAMIINLMSGNKK